MLLSRSCMYGLRAATLVAVKEREAGRQFTPIRELADELSLSFHFLTKILQTLTEARILQSFRGPTGGVGLAAPAESIRLIDIVAAIDGVGVFDECVLGLPGCGKMAPCPIHDSWVKRREELRRMFTRETLASLADTIDRKRLRM